MFSHSQVLLSILMPNIVAVVWLYFVRAKIERPHILLNLSFGLAVLFVALAALSIFLTQRNPISTEACLLGIFGMMAVMIVAAIDALSLLLLVFQHKEQRKHYMTFLAVRILAYLATGATFLMTASLCTV